MRMLFDLFVFEINNVQMYVLCGAYVVMNFYF